MAAGPGARMSKQAAACTTKALPVLPAGCQEALPSVQHHHSARRPAENLLVSYTPGGLASSSPTCRLCDVTLPPVHTCTQVPRVHTCTYTHARAHVCGSGARVEAQAQPCLLVPTKTGDHACSRFCSQGWAGRCRWGECWARLLRSSPQTDRRTDRHANTRLKHM